MHFVMYLNDQEVDSIPLPPGKVNISHLMQDLKNKHRDLLKSAKADPVFALEQVASHVNSFQPLKAAALKQNNVSK